LKRLRRRVCVSRKNLRILLGTSFTLPFLGFKTSEAVMKALPRLRGHELYYSDLSAPEALWKAMKVVKKEDLAIVLEGLKLLKRDLNCVRVDEKAVAGSSLAVITCEYL
jgi:predicted nucleic acid-binding protein